MNKDIDKRIVVRRLSDDGVSIIIPIKQEGQTEDDALRAALDKIDSFTMELIKVCDKTELPTRDEFRNAWKIDKKTNGVDFDLKKAGDIKLDALRLVRNKALKELDLEVMKAQEKGLSITALAAKKQALRDMPISLQPDLAKAKTIEDIKLINIDHLL